jgi:hypothetical protein
VGKAEDLFTRRGALVVISLEYMTTFVNLAVKFEVRSVLCYWGILYGRSKLMHAGACQGVRPIFSTAKDFKIWLLSFEIWENEYVFLDCVRYGRE